MLFHGIIINESWIKPLLSLVFLLLILLIAGRILFKQIPRRSYLLNLILWCGLLLWDYITFFKGFLNGN